MESTELDSESGEQLAEVSNPHQLPRQLFGLIFWIVLFALFVYRFTDPFTTASLLLPVGLLGGLTFADAWVCGIYKDPNKKSFLNISPMAWGILMAVFYPVAYPVYALIRNRLRTIHGTNGLFIAVLIVGGIIILSSVPSLTLLTEIYVATLAALVCALVWIRKSRKKDNAQAARAKDEVNPLEKIITAASKRYVGLTGWAWLLAGVAVFLVWERVSALKSGGGVGEFVAALGAMAFAVAAAVYVFRDWVISLRVSRVWRVINVTGVALASSVVAFDLANSMFYWGSCVSGDCQSGHGTFNYVRGDTYEGEWRYGQPGPLGTIRYIDGTTYAGEWVDGRPEGQGTTTFPNGDVYVGEHFGFSPWGTGTKTYADGRVESGRWESDRLVEPE